MITGNEPANPGVVGIPGYGNQVLVGVHPNTGDNMYVEYAQGKTILQSFAESAMTGLLASTSQEDGSWDARILAERSVKYAQTLIDELNKHIS